MPRRRSFSVAGCGCLLIVVGFASLMIHSQLPHVRARRAAAKAARQHVVELGGRILEGSGDVIDGGIVLRNTPASNDDLVNLHYLQGFVDRLDLAGTHITDSGLMHVAKLKHVSLLDLSDTRISDDGLRHLASLQLFSLNLAGTQVTDRGLRHLSSFRYLRKLDLSRTKVTNTGLAHLRDLRLTRLNLTKTRVRGPVTMAGATVILPPPPELPLPVVDLAGRAETGVDAAFPLMDDDRESLPALVDGDQATAWSFRKVAQPGLGPFSHWTLPTLQWPVPIEVTRIKIHQKGDRIKHLTVESHSEEGDRWFPLATIRAEPRLVFVSGSRDMQHVRINGYRLDQMQRPLGSQPDAQLSPVVDIRLPRPRAVRRLRIRIREATGNPITLTEWEVHGRELHAEAPQPRRSDAASSETAARFFRAAHQGDLPTIRSLLDEHPLLLGRTDVEWGETALSKAAWSGRLEVAVFLIERGAPINPRAFDDITPLHQAARRGHAEIVRLLLDNGADPKAKDNKGLTPAEWAAREGNTEIASEIRGR